MLSIYQQKGYIRRLQAAGYGGRGFCYHLPVTANIRQQLLAELTSEPAKT